MTYQVLFSPTARTDLVSAARWIRENFPRSANRWAAGLERTIAKLRDNAHRHPIAEDESEQFGVEIRQLLHGRGTSVYRILYTIEEDRAIILFIRHSTRGSI